MLRRSLPARPADNWQEAGRISGLDRVAHRPAPWRPSDSWRRAARRAGRPPMRRSLAAPPRFGYRPHLQGEGVEGGGRRLFPALRVRTCRSARRDRRSVQPEALSRVQGDGDDDRRRLPLGGLGRREPISVCALHPPRVGLCRTVSLVPQGVRSWPPRPAPRPATSSRRSSHMTSASSSPICFRRFRGPSLKCATGMSLILRPCSSSKNVLPSSFESSASERLAESG